MEEPAGLIVTCQLPYPETFVGQKILIDYITLGRIFEEGGKQGRRLPGDFVAYC